MSRLHLQLFGGVALVGEGLELKNFGTVRAAKLLVLLALSRNGRMPRTQLADQLWPDDFYDSTRLRLRQELHRLKRLMGDFSEWIGSDTNDVWLDRTQLRTDLDILQEISRGKVPDGFEYCVREEFLPGWDDDWAMGERGASAKLQLAAAVALGNSKLEQGRAADALEMSRKLIAQFPIHEELRMVAVNAHCALGSVSSAVAEYQEYKREVKDRLGIDAKDLDTAAMVERAYAAEQAAIPEPEVSIPSPSPSPTLPTHADEDWPAIPNPIDPIVGRDEFTLQILDRLEQPAIRLITLVGPGGVGKTRLAVEVARRIFDRGTLRVGFVSLAEVTDPAQWIRHILTTLRHDPPTESDPFRYLAVQLKTAPTLLLLDNIESVMPDGASDLRRLLGECPDLRVIGTSVRPVRIPEEVLVPIGPLAAATDGFEFLRSSLIATRPQLLSQSGTEDDLRRLAIQLDGYPLALRLASARFRLLSPKALLDQLETSLTASHRNDIPDRHRSMENALATSFGAISDAEQKMLSQIAAFPGGLSIELAGSIFTDTNYLDQLEALLDTALITLDESGSRVRIKMPMPVQAYVLARNKESRDTLDGRAARGILEYLGQFDLSPRMAVVPTVLEEIDPETENLSFAWRWALENDPAAAITQAGRFARFENARGRAAQRLPQVEALRAYVDPSDTETLIELDLVYVFLASACHRENLTKEPLDRVQILADQVGDLHLAAWAAFGIANHSFREDFFNAEPLVDRALELSRESGDRYIEAKSHHLLSTIANYKSHFEKSLDHAAMAYQIMTELDAGSEAGGTGVNYAGNLWKLGHLVECREVMDRSREVLLVSRVPGALAFYNEMEGRFALDSGDHASAADFFRESLRLWETIGSDYQVADQNFSLCRCAMARGDLAPAWTHLIAAAEHWRRDENQGGVCCALIYMAVILAAEGKTDRAREVLAYSVDFENHFNAIIVEEVQKWRAETEVALGEMSSPGWPLTMDYAMSLFKRPK